MCIRDSYFAARHIEIPLVHIEDINPAMNFATIRLKGYITKRPYVRKNYLSFELDDGTGTIRIRAYGRLANEITPLMRGDLVEVVGNVTVRDGTPVVLINSADRVRLLNEPSIIKIREITMDKLGELVRIKGHIRSIRKIKNGALMEVMDSTGVMRLVVWDKNFNAFPGQEIDCRGRVKLYQGELEVVTHGKVKVKF